MNSLKHRNGGIIVEREKITICKHMDSIQITIRIRFVENIINDILPKEIEIYEEINLKVENNFIKRKLEPQIEKLEKRHQTISMMSTYELLNILQLDVYSNSVDV